jgi:hypothetical protein
MTSHPEASEEPVPGNSKESSIAMHDDNFSANSVAGTSVADAYEGARDPISAQPMSHRCSLNGGSIESGC